MEKILHKVRIVTIWFIIGWTGFLATFSFWLKYRMEDGAKDMLALRLIDAIDLYSSALKAGVEQDTLDYLVQRQIHSFRIGRFGTVMHVKDHTIIAAADSGLVGQQMPDLEFQGGIEEGNFFKMTIHGEKCMVAMEKVDKLYIIGLLPYSEIYHDLYLCLLFHAAAVIASVLSLVFLYRKIRAEHLPDGKAAAQGDDGKQA